MPTQTTDPPPPGKPHKPGEELAEKAQSAYRWWDNLATINAEDPLWVGAGKIGIRILGVLILLALSPLILLGIVMAFAAVA